MYQKGEQDIFERSIRKSLHKWYLISLEAFQGWMLPLDQLLIFPFSPPNAFAVLTSINHWNSYVLQLTFESCQHQLKFVVRYFYHTTKTEPFPYHSWFSTIPFLPLLSFTTFQPQNHPYCPSLYLCYLKMCRAACPIQEMSHSEFIQGPKERALSLCLS